MVTQQSASVNMYLHTQPRPHRHRVQLEASTTLRHPFATRNQQGVTKIQGSKAILLGWNLSVSTAFVDPLAFYVTQFQAILRASETFQLFKVWQDIYQFKYTRKIIVPTSSEEFICSYHLF